MAHQISGGGNARIRRGGDNPSGDDAGRHGGGGESGRPAVHAARWQKSVVAADESRDSDHRGLDGGPRVRDRRCENHAGARCERLRGGATPQIGGNRRDDRRRQDERGGGRLRRYGPLRGEERDC